MATSRVCPDNLGTHDKFHVFGKFIGLNLELVLIWDFLGIDVGQLSRILRLNDVHYLEHEVWHQQDLSLTWVVRNLTELRVLLSLVNVDIIGERVVAAQSNPEHDSASVHTACEDKRSLE